MERLRRFWIEELGNWEISLNTKHSMRCKTLIELKEISQFPNPKFQNPVISQSKIHNLLKSPSPSTFHFAYIKKKE